MNNFKSDKQRKAVMASISNSGNVGLNAAHEGYDNKIDSKGQRRKLVVGDYEYEFNLPQDAKRVDEGNWPEHLIKQIKSDVLVKRAELSKELLKWEGYIPKIKEKMSVKIPEIMELNKKYKELELESSILQREINKYVDGKFKQLEKEHPDKLLPARYKVEEWLANKYPNFKELTVKIDKVLDQQLKIDDVVEKLGFSDNLPSTNKEILDWKNWSDLDIGGWDVSEIENNIDDIQHKLDNTTVEKFKDKIESKVHRYIKDREWRLSDSKKMSDEDWKELI